MNESYTRTRQINDVYKIFVRSANNEIILTDHVSDVQYKSYITFVYFFVYFILHYFIFHYYFLIISRLLVILCISYYIVCSMHIVLYIYVLQSMYIYSMYHIEAYKFALFLFQKYLRRQHCSLNNRIFRILKFQ